MVASRQWIPTASWVTSEMGDVDLMEIAKAMSEKDLQRSVMAMAMSYGWLHYSIPDSRWATSRGYPDLTMAQKGRIMFVELKTMKGRLSEHQERWLLALESVETNEVHVWRPSDLLDGTIERYLSND